MLNISILSAVAPIPKKRPTLPKYEKRALPELTALASPENNRLECCGFAMRNCIIFNHKTL
jgi:hypothetical protein